MAKLKQPFILCSYDEANTQKSIVFVNREKFSCLFHPFSVIPDYFLVVEALRAVSLIFLFQNGSGTFL